MAAEWVSTVRWIVELVMILPSRCVISHLSMPSAVIRSAAEESLSGPSSASVSHALLPFSAHSPQRPRAEGEMGEGPQ